MNIALFGPPGAGKGTQSERLIKRYKLFYISTGDLLRKELKEKTALGKEAESIIASGGLVPDEIIVQIIEKTIAGNRQANGFLFDGFPRTTIQAYILEGLMMKLGASLTCLINLEVPEEVSIERLLARGRTSGRSDDNEAVIRNRLKEYHEKTRPVLDFFRSRGVVFDIDATDSIEEVHRKVDAVVQGELQKHLFNVVLFGYPGCGRGSQGKALADHFGLEYVATGSMLDEEIREDTPTGRKIRKLYENGDLVPDEIVVPLIEKKLEHSENVRGFIFKGFPRTLVQSYILDGLLRKRDSYLHRVIEIEVPLLELVERLDKRSGTDRCMPYDTSAARIVRRLQEHEEKTIPVIRKYEEAHSITRVDGQGSFGEVFERLAAEIELGIRRLHA